MRAASRTLSAVTGAAAGRRGGGVEHVQRVAGVAAGRGHDLLAQLVGRARRPSAASPRRTIASMSAASSGRSSNSWQRQSSAELTSKYGFSVVAPISVTRPDSTAGSSASCWALLKRWISSRNRIVAGRCAQALARLAEHRGARRPRRPARPTAPRSAPRGGGDDPRQRRLAGAGRPVEDHRGDAVVGDRPPQGAARADHGAWPTNSSSVCGRSLCASGATDSSCVSAESEKRSRVIPQIYSSGGGRSSGGQVKRRVCPAQRRPPASPARPHAAQKLTSMEWGSRRPSATPVTEIQFAYSGQRHVRAVRLWAAQADEVLDRAAGGCRFGRGSARGCARERVARAGVAAMHDDPQVCPCDRPVATATPDGEGCSDEEDEGARAHAPSDGRRAGTVPSAAVGWHGVV